MRRRRRTRLLPANSGRARHHYCWRRPSSSSSALVSSSGITASAMLASVLLLLALLPPTADAGALPLAFFRQLQRLPYFGHGASGRHDATSKLLSDANQAAQHAHAPPQAQSSKPHYAGGPGIRPVGPKEEANRKEQEKHRPHPLHRPPHAYTDRPTNRMAVAAEAAAAAEGAKIVVPPPTTSGNATTALGASAQHVHHWGLRGNGYHAVMAGKWTAGQWHALEAPMNLSLRMGDLLPSRHRRPQALKQRAAAQQQQKQRGEDLLYGAHQLMKGMRAGAQRPDVTAIWRALLLSPPGPGGRIGSNKKIHGPPRVSTTRGNKGVSPSPLYILISQQSACGMLLRSLDDSLRRLIELVDRLPSPTPAVLPASILAHSYLWHLSPPSSASASAPAPHLAGAVHLATLHAVRLEREGPAGGEWGGNGTDDADDPLINPIAACSTLTHSPLIRAYQGRPYHSHPFRSRSISHIYLRPPHHLKAPRAATGAPHIRNRSGGGGSSSSSTNKRVPVSVSPRMEGEAYLGSYKLLYYPEGLPLLARAEDYNFFYALSAAVAGTAGGAVAELDEEDEEAVEQQQQEGPSWRAPSAPAVWGGVEHVRERRGVELELDEEMDEELVQQERQHGHEAPCDCAHKQQQQEHQQQEAAPEEEEQERHRHAVGGGGGEKARPRWERSRSSSGGSSSSYSGSSGWGLASQALLGAAALLLLPILAILGITLIIARLLLHNDDDATDGFVPGATTTARGGLVLPPPSPSLASSAYSSRCATPRTTGGGPGAKALNLHSPRSATGNNNWTTSLRGSMAGSSSSSMMPPSHPHGAGVITPRSGLASPHTVTAHSVPGSPSHRARSSIGGGRRTEPGSPAAGAGAGGAMAMAMSRRPPFYPSSSAPSHISNHSISVFSSSPLSSRGVSPNTIGSPRSVSSRGGSIQSRRGARPDKINGRSVKWTTATGGVGVGSGGQQQQPPGWHKAMVMSAPAPQQIIRER